MKKLIWNSNNPCLQIKRGKHTSTKHKDNYTNSIYIENNNNNINNNKYNSRGKHIRNISNNTMWYNSSRNKKRHRHRSSNTPELNFFKDSDGKEGNKKKDGAKLETK